MQMNPVERVQGYAETSTENYDGMILEDLSQNEVL